MKRLILVLSGMLCFSGLYAQPEYDDRDVLRMVNLDNVDVRGSRMWENDTARYRYNQMRHYVKMILPYLDAATEMFQEMELRMEQGNMNNRERKQYVRAREEVIREQFEDRVRALNTTQGVLLVKLIARQTGVNIYEMLGSFKNPLTAVKWQAWARMNGLNLNQQYKPETEPDLESIMEGLGYPLPGFYSQVY